MHYARMLITAFSVLWLTGGCVSKRVDNHTTLNGRPVMEFMTQIGQPLEGMALPDGGEGRVLNEAQKLWHYLSVSPTTSLILLRSRYSNLLNAQETVIAKFENPAFGTFNINAQDLDIEDGIGIDVGHIKFTASVDNPSPGIAKAEIYPFPRKNGQSTIPPSLQLVLPPRFIVPAGSDIDPRKRYMQDEQSITVLQNIVHEIFAFARRTVVLPSK